MESRNYHLQISLSQILQVIGYLTWNKYAVGQHSSNLDCNAIWHKNTNENIISSFGCSGSMSLPPLPFLFPKDFILLILIPFFSNYLYWMIFLVPLLFLVRSTFLKLVVWKKHLRSLFFLLASFSFFPLSFSLCPSVTFLSWQWHFSSILSLSLSFPALCIKIELVGWKKAMDDKRKSILEELNTVFDTSRNFQNYRAALANSGGRATPILGFTSLLSFSSFVPFLILVPPILILLLRSLSHSPPSPSPSFPPSLSHSPSSLFVSLLF